MYWFYMLAMDMKLYIYSLLIDIGSLKFENQKMYLACMQKNCSLLTISHRHNILSLTQKKKCVALKKMCYVQKTNVILSYVVSYRYN